MIVIIIWKWKLISWLLRGSRETKNITESLQSLQYSYNYSYCREYCVSVHISCSECRLEIYLGIKCQKNHFWYWKSFVYDPTYCCTGVAPGIISQRVNRAFKFWIGEPIRSHHCHVRRKNNLLNLLILNRLSNAYIISLSWVSNTCII